MNVAIYRIPNFGAKDWPPHAGDRPAQRAAIRAALMTIRHVKASTGGHVHIGAGGVSVRYTHAGYGACSLSGYSLRHCYTALAAMVAGVPWVDTRPIRDVGVLIAAPMVAVGQAPDPAPWHGFSYAPLEAVFRPLRRRRRACRQPRARGTLSADGGRRETGPVLLSRPQEGL